MSTDPDSVKNGKVFLWNAKNIVKTQAHVAQLSLDYKFRFYVGLDLGFKLPLLIWNGSGIPHCVKVLWESAVDNLNHGLWFSR